MSYKIELSYKPIRGDVSDCKRWRYPETKKIAFIQAKRIIVREDYRRKEFIVRILLRKSGKYLAEWIKVDGKIHRTK